MTSPSRSVDASYAYCQALTRRARSSFRMAMRLLPPPKRRALEALYAFMRHTDDLGDNPLPVPQRQQALAQWRGIVARGLAGQLPPDADAPADASRPPAPGEAAAGLALLPALADTVARYEVPHEHLYAVIDGQEMDLAGCHYATFDDLAVYCHRVASAVGLACLHIWGFRGPEAFEPARHCGLAFQLTNILRDLKEDAALGRIYLPDCDLLEAGYTDRDLRQGVVDERFHRLMALEIRRATHHYREAAGLRSWLLPDGRRSFNLMFGAYRQLLANIAADPPAVFRRRVGLSLLQKTCVVGRCLIGLDKAV